MMRMRTDQPAATDHREPTLFDVGLAPTIEPIEPHPDSLEAAFDEFHRRNPWVYDALVRLARDLRSRGRERVGIGMLFEVLRWQWALATTDASSDFRLNNNYRSRYARLIMDNEADLDGMFETRKLTAA